MKLHISFQDKKRGLAWLARAPLHDIRLSERTSRRISTHGSHSDQSNSKTKKFEHKEKFFFIELESLLSKDKKKLHELFNFCKLEYPKKEFNFQEKYTLVKNASNIQIREKINFYDKKKYSPYYKILDQYKKKYNWIKI